MTLQEAIDLALRQNVDVLLAQKNLDSFESRVRETVGAAVPHISLSGTYARNFKKPVIFFQDQAIEISGNHSVNAEATAVQPLYTGGKVGTALKAARQQREIGKEVLQATRDEVVLTVKRLFYGSLLAQSLADIQKDNLNSAEDHLATIKERYKQGLDSDLTVRRQEVEVANAKATLIQAKNLEEISVTNLQEVLSMDVSQPLYLTGRLEPPKESLSPYNTYAAIALEHQPQLQAARRRTTVARDLIAIERADYLPSLSLFATYRWSAEANEWPPQKNERVKSMLGGLEAQYNLFSGGQTYQRVRQAKIAFEQAKDEERRVERSVRVDVKKEWLAVSEALERSRAQESAVDQATMALKATEIRYRAGQSNQLELNDATFALNRVRMMYSQASHDYLVSRAALERAVGVPLKEGQP